eukprot:TRINITY_DN5614_c0_g1_i1.p1 TRINITY_DN5614_c0_g1~~TRINITY_DN5614_c0_g1_i1.p1  ORF type:complete len:458 (-),score=80.92 TRINITY_DN5614_c0_g1_i1:31-1332(-)
MALTKSEGKSTTGSFSIACLVTQVLLVAVAFPGGYDMTALSKIDSSSVYNFYVGVALMMFVGFGYLMTFLRGYGLGAVGFTMFITCLGVQWALWLEMVFVTGSPSEVKWSFMSFLNGNFAVAAVLISFGGLIGKVSPTQLLVITLLELTFYCANKVFFLTNLLNIADCGGTIIIHVFGAYFGLAACATLGPAQNEDLNGSSYNSDLFSLIGTVFLWLYWPSFVAGGLPAGTEGHGIALLNTVIALLASTVITFGIMPLMSGNRLGTVPVQNATLAGGVAIGATANLAMGPAAAGLIGVISGAISCVGFIKPVISSAYDTCGINNLHGMPGIFGGIVSVIMPIVLGLDDIKPANQAIGLIGTLVVAILTGAVTGFIAKAIGSPDAAFNDEAFWDCKELPGAPPPVTETSASAPVVLSGARTVYCCSSVGPKGAP